MLRSGAKRFLAGASALTLLLGTSSANAGTTTGFGAWGGLEGEPRAYTTTMQLPGTGYPLAQVASDSASGASLPGGTSTWWGATTPPGQRFGSSQGQAYLNLRPRQDNATSPSTTTYTFERAAPTGWGFVLGDIDSDQVRITATTVGGAPVSTADLGFQGVFNPCSSTPRPSGCSGPEVKDVPTWDPATATLIGNPAGENTYGADGWFVPTVPVRTLTFTFTRRTGFPVFQTWFASRAQDVRGTVSVASGSCDLTTATLTLLDDRGDPLASVRPAADGTYGFDRVAATDAFRVRLDPPEGCRPVGPDVADLDLRTDDAVADFVVRQVVTGTATGTVTDESTGDGVPGATVRITDPDTTASAVTDADGAFVVPDLDPGDYEAMVDPPDGFAVVGAATVPLTVPSAGGTVDVDFTLRPVAAGPGPTPAPAPSAPTAGVASGLPDVGGPPVWIPPGGLALVVAGGWVLLSARRRGRTAPASRRR